MEAAGGGETVSLNCAFLGSARAGERIEAHVEAVRRTRSLVFLSVHVTADGRAVLTADGLIACP
jgi:acyl-coenzyme A thioesterase PaaI-like protein